MFTDIPILLSYFSLHPEVYFQKNAFSSHSSIGNTVNDIIINATSVNIPILIRYTYPTSKVRPYINIGGTFNYNIRNDNAFYTTTIYKDTIKLGETNKNKIYSEIQIGYTIGGGIQYNVDYRKSIFIEIRYINLYGLTDETYDHRSMQCFIGINF
jgi:opacity protein-like surface antigen